jgi:hypothetical protein
VAVDLRPRFLGAKSLWHNPLNFGGGIGRG